MTAFGAGFKKAREAKRLSLDQIAIETRISTRFLQAIESEEFHLLPGGIFNRGFVRTFAERVGMDPDQAVLDYQRIAEYREPDEPACSVPAKRGNFERNLYPIAIGVLVLLIVIFYKATRDTGTTGETNSQASTQPALTTPARGIPETPAAPQPQPAEPESAPLPEPVVVEMEVHEPTWIKVTADGSIVSQDGELLQPGMTRRFTAQKSLDLAIGNAGGITLKINGREIQRLGRSGQVREFTITPENVTDIAR